jgi:hypothetical protein
MAVVAVPDESPFLRLLADHHREPAVQDVTTDVRDRPAFEVEWGTWVKLPLGTCVFGPPGSRWVVIPWKAGSKRQGSWYN